MVRRHATRTVDHRPAVGDDRNPDQFAATIREVTVSSPQAESPDPPTAPSPMTRDRAIELLRGGAAGIDTWNRHREQGGDVPSLADAAISDTRTPVTSPGPYLQGADLRKCILSGVRLVGADLRSAALGQTDLSKAKLSGARLQRVTLALTNLSGADLTYANLIGATLLGADLTGASVEGADFRRAEFVSARIAPRLRWWQRVRLGDWVNWQTVRSLGSLQVLTKVSYVMLAAVPLLAGVWLAVIYWTAPAGLKADMPTVWAYAFFAALFAAAGHLVYQIWAPELVKETTAEKFATEMATGFSTEPIDSDDRLTRAIASLREYAKLVPLLRNANLVIRHGRVVWIPSRLEHFREIPPDYAPDDDEGTPNHSLMRMAVEEGALAEYAIQARQQRVAAGFAIAFYAMAVLLICRIVAGQAWSVSRAVGWV